MPDATATADPAVQAHEVVARELLSRPWLAAEDDSIWLASGRYADGGSFTDCLIRALPHQVTGGCPLFVHLPPLSAVTPGAITPAQVTRARRLVLVWADDPGQAYDPDEQDLLEVRCG